MSTKKFYAGQHVTFQYGGIRSVKGIVKENRGPIGMNGRVLYLIEFYRDGQTEDVSRIELPADRLEAVGNTASSV